MDSKTAFYHNSLEKLRAPDPKLKNERNLIAPVILNTKHAF